MRDITHFIDGQSVAGKRSARWTPPCSPPCAPSRAGRWRRARVMFEYKRLLEANMNALAEMLSAEHGKVIADSKGDIQRGPEGLTDDSAFVIPTMN